MSKLLTSCPLYFAWVGMLTRKETRPKHWIMQRGIRRFPWWMGTLESFICFSWHATSSVLTQMTGLETQWRTFDRNISVRSPWCVSARADCAYCKQHPPPPPPLLPIMFRGLEGVLISANVPLHLSHPEVLWVQKQSQCEYHPYNYFSSLSESLEWFQKKLSSCVGVWFALNPPFTNHACYFL